MALKDMLPLSVEIDGPASCQIDEECIFIIDKNKNRIASINRDSCDAALIATRIAVSMNKFSALVECCEALRALVNACTLHGGTVYTLHSELEAARAAINNVEKMK